MEVIEFRKCSKCEYTGRIQVCKNVMVNQNLHLEKQLKR